MQKTLLTLGLSLITTTTLFAQTTTSFQISGLINPEITCNIAAEDINLQPITAGDLKSVGEMSAWESANITLSECNLGISAGKPTANVDLSINPGAAVPTNDRYWQIAEQAHIAIELNVNETQIPASGATVSSPDVSDDNQVPPFTTKARIVRISDGAMTPGAFNFTVSAIATYK